MGTKIITTCDKCSKERSSQEEMWLSGSMSTDGGNGPSCGGGGIYCSVDCLKGAVDAFLAALTKTELE